MEEYKYKKGDKVEYLRQLSPDIWAPAEVVHVYELCGQEFLSLKTPSGWITDHAAKNVRLKIPELMS